MTIKNPLKTSFAMLAVAASLMSASAAWSQSTKQQEARKRVNASRRAELVKIEAGLKAMCDTVRGWNVKTPNPPTGAEKCKNGHGMDCDMPAWSDESNQKETFRANLDTTRKACDEALSGDRSLAQLLKEDAPLYRIPKKPVGNAERGVWDELVEELAETVNSYNGGFGGGENYLSRMKEAGKNATAKGNAMNQLVLDGSNTLPSVVNDVQIQKDKPVQLSALHQAVAAVADKK